ncbi:MAG: SLC13 family permease [Vampirovibrionia bacterium]
MSYFVLLSIITLIILLYKNVSRPSILFFSYLCLYLIMNLISVKSFLFNFTNISLITLILLLVITSVLAKLDILYLLNKIDGTNKYTLLKLGLATSLISAFINNTLITSLALKSLHKHKHVRLLLLPITFLTIIGGTVTLIGTSTNMIVNSLVTNYGLKTLDMFQLSYVGIPLVIAGLIYLILFSDKILKIHEKQETIKEPNYFLEAKINIKSPLIGKSIEENKLRNLENIFLAEIIRNNILISPVSPDEIIEENDILVFTGDINNIKDLQKFDGLEIFEEENEILQNNLIWAVLSHNSLLIDKTIKESNFRSIFDCAVVAVKRGKEKLSGKIGNIKLSAGDYLILAVSKDFYKNDRIKENFYICNELQINDKLKSRDSYIVIFSFIIAVIISAIGIISLFKALIILLFLYIALKYITIQEILKSFNYELLILVGSALGISNVLMDSGAAKLVSDTVINLTSYYGVEGCFVGIYLLTILFTQIMHNNAVVALVFPVAITLTTNLGVNPLPFIMAILYGASASFISPYGYQVNLMVLNSGYYKPKDFFILGLPLIIIYSIIVLLLVPYFFKF